MKKVRLQIGYFITKRNTNATGIADVITPHYAESFAIKPKTEEVN